MLRLPGIFLAAIVALTLTGCKTQQEINATSFRYSTQLRLLEAAVEPLKASDATNVAAKRMADACGRLAFLSDPADKLPCKNLSSLVALYPIIQQTNARLVADQEALKAYAAEAERIRFLESFSEEVEAARRLLVATVKQAHWEWTQSINLSLRRFDDAAMESAKLDVPKDFLLAALPKDYRNILSDRLERERATLTALGQADRDALHEQTLASIVEWREGIGRAESIVDKVQALRDEIVKGADNKTWDESLAKSGDSGPPNEMPQLAADLNVQLSNPLFEAFLRRVASVQELRSRIVASTDSTVAPPLSAAANERLIEDCRSLLVLDEKSADQICGGASAALEFALNVGVPSSLHDQGFGGTFGPSPSGPGGAGGPPVSPRDQSSGRNSGPPVSEPERGPSADGQPVIQIPKALKALLKRDTAATPTPNDRERPSPQAVNAHVEALKARVTEVSRAHAQASIQGYFSKLAEHEAQLELVHETMRVAVGGSLPEGLKEPLALLSRPAADSALRETQRLQRIVSLNLTLVPDAPELVIASQALSDRAKKLAGVLAAPPSQTDYASVIRKIDPEKAKALLDGNPWKLAQLVQQRKETWKDKFVGVVSNFDTWRGPRGPPAPDPKFPRSERVLAAITMLGSNPTEAIQAFSALKAEHAEFYREANKAGDALKDWEFGKSEPRAWMVSLLSPPDLAVAASVLKEMEEIPPALKITDGWSELADASERLQKAINVETKLRVETRGGHPPGYPPGKPPEVTRVAEQYSQDWNKRTPQRVERQMRLQTAKLMYPDTTMMPAAVRTEVRTIVNGALDDETTRLEALLASLYGKSGRDGLLDRAARSVNKLPDKEFAALIAAKEKTVRAAKIVAERVADAENDRLIQHDPQRWARITGWFRGFGEDPPTAALPVTPSPPLAPAGTGGANFLFADSELERSFVEITAALDSAEASLKVAEPISTVSVKATAVGAEPGRAVANRLNWKNGKFSFEGLGKSADQSLTRYPEGLRKWEGFFHEDNGIKAPFHFDRYVKNFTNFRGVGGGIHFGETATSGDVDKVVKEGGLLTYDEASQTIKLILPSGTYSYDPIPPRVLKALYAYATAYPGINLAVTIGVAGDHGIVRDSAGAPVLLDPSFVDNPVGQDLYLADIVPWGLDKPTLPNGAANVASEDFVRAQQARTDEELTETKKIVQLVGTLQPLGSFNVGRLKELFKDNPNGPVIVAVASSKDVDEFKKVYQDVAVDQAVRRYQGSTDLDKALAAVEKQAEELRRAGYSSKDVSEAITIVQSGGPSIGRLPGFSNDQFDLDSRLRPRRPGASLADVFRLNNIAGDKLLFFRIVGLYLGSGGEQAARAALVSDYSKSVAQSERQFSDKLVSDERFKFLNTETDPANRVLRSLGFAVQLDTAKNEVRVPQDVMRLAAAALSDLGKRKGTPLDLTEIASQLPRTLCDSRGLAVLFDQSVSFSLSDGKIRIVPKMSYRYAVASTQVASTDLVCEFDGTDPKTTVKAKYLKGLAAVANANIDAIVNAYPPLKNVREYAGVAAFLKWAACPTAVEQSCRQRDGLTIDLSALGRYDLRDRERTPTPDMDLNVR